MRLLYTIFPVSAKRYKDMNLTQNQLEDLQNRMMIGELTAERANIEKVKIQRVLVVSHLPHDVRKSLNFAVKNGELGHMKKDGKKPEVYFNPIFEYLARSERNTVERETIKALSSVCV